MAASAADKKPAGFTAPEIDSLPKQTIDSVTLGVRAYSTEAQTREAFGKVDPNRYGVLPVFIAVRNGGKKTIRLNAMQPVYITSNGGKLEPTPAAEVPYLQAPQRPKMPGTTPLPPIPLPKKKNPLAGVEIESRAFSAKMLPPGESASGFLYFQTDHRGGASFYLTGLRDAASGNELFYFEIPFE